MGEAAYPLIEQCDFHAGDAVVEIGAERGEGSTGYLHRFCQKHGIPFYSVDFDPVVAARAEDLTGADVCVGRGEDFLADRFPRDQRIRFAYLDNFDWTPTHLHGGEDIDFVVVARERYAELGVTMHNGNCQLAHFAQAVLVDAFSAERCTVLFDDTWTTGVGFDGKGGLAAGYLARRGYTVKPVGRQAVVATK
jgi:hypothetical protein